VSVGDYASVYTDGSTVTGYIARVTAIGGGGLTLTLSTTAISGTAPTTGATGISCTTGGAWLGPNGATAFPFGFITSAATNVAGNPYRVNYKNNATYNVTAAISHNKDGFGVHQGYTSSAGDGGRATIDGGTSGTSYILFSVDGYFIEIRDFIFAHNGATGTADGVRFNHGIGLAVNLVCHDVKGYGLRVLDRFTLVECEAYNCGSNGYEGNASYNAFIRCIAHDNTTNGFSITGSSVLVDCIADTNGGSGIKAEGGNNQILTCIKCDCYNNTSDGITLSVGNTAVAYIENCNLIKNGGWGINDTVSTTVNVLNCGFGAGTQANTSGTTSFVAGSGYTIAGSVTYASNVTPWVDPANGDFRINLAAAKNAGRGNFTETAASYAGAVGYPDIGAAQHQDAASTGGFTPPVAPAVVAKSPSADPY